MNELNLELGILKSELYGKTRETQTLEAHTLQQPDSLNRVNDRHTKRAAPSKMHNKESKHEALQKELLKAQNQYSACYDELLHREKLLHKFKEENIQLTERITQQSQDISKMREERKRLELKLAVVTERHKTAQQEVNNRDQIILQLKTDLKTSQEKYFGSQEELKLQEEEVSRLQQKMKGLQTEARELWEKCSVQEDQLNQVEKTKQQFLHEQELHLGQLQNYEMLVEKLQSDLDQAKQSHTSDLERLNQKTLLMQKELVSETSAHQADLLKTEEYKEQIASLEHRLKSADLVLHEANQKIEVLDKTIKSQKSSLELLQQQNRTLEKNITENNSHTKELVSALEMCKKKYRACIDSVKSLEKQVGDLQEDAKEANREIADKKETIQSLEAKVLILQRQCKEKSDQVETFEHLIDQLTAELNSSKDNAKLHKEQYQQCEQLAKTMKENSDRLQKQIYENESDIKKICSELMEYRSVHSHSNEEYNSLTLQLQKHQGEIEILKEQLNEKNTKIEECHTIIEHQKSDAMKVLEQQRNYSLEMKELEKTLMSLQLEIVTSQQKHKRERVRLEQQVTWLEAEVTNAKQVCVQREQAISKRDDLLRKSEGDLLQAREGIKEKAAEAQHLDSVVKQLEERLHDAKKNINQKEKENDVLRAEIKDICAELQDVQKLNRETAQELASQEEKLLLLESSLKATQEKLSEQITETVRQEQNSRKYQTDLKILKERLAASEEENSDYKKMLENMKNDLTSLKEQHQLTVQEMLQLQKSNHKYQTEIASVQDNACNLQLQVSMSKVNTVKNDLSIKFNQKDRTRLLTVDVETSFCGRLLHRFIALMGMPTKADLEKLIERYEAAHKRDITVVRHEISVVESRVTVLEKVGNATDSRVRALEERCTKQEAIIKAYHLHLDDLENRSRRNNLRIRGIPESQNAEDARAIVTAIFNELLGRDPSTSIELDRAHRALGPRSTDPSFPRDIVCKVHLFTVKEKILRKAWTKGPAQNYNELVKSLREELNQWQCHCQEEQNRVEEFQKRTADMESEIKKLRDRNENDDQKIKEQEIQLIKLEDEIRQLQETNSSSQSGLLEAQAQMKILHLNLSTAEKQIKHYMTQAEFYEEAIAKLQGDLEQSKKRCRKSIKNLESAEQNIYDLNLEMTLLQANHKQTVEQLNQKNKETSVFNSELISLRHQNEKLKDELSELKLKLKQATVDLEKFQDLNQCTKEEIFKQEETVQEITNKLALAQKQTEDMSRNREKRLSALEKDHTALQEKLKLSFLEVANLQSELKTSEKKCITAQRELEILCQALEATQTDNSRLHQESDFVADNVNQWIKEQKQAKETLAEKIHEQNQLLTHLTEERDHFQKKEEALLTVVNKLKADLEKSNTQNADLKLIPESSVFRKIAIFVSFLLFNSQGLDRPPEPRFIVLLLPVGSSLNQHVFTELDVGRCLVSPVIDVIWIFEDLPNKKDVSLCLVKENAIKLQEQLTKLGEQLETQELEHTSLLEKNLAATEDMHSRLQTNVKSIHFLNTKLTELGQENRYLREQLADEKLKCQQCEHHLKISNQTLSNLFTHLKVLQEQKDFLKKEPSYKAFSSCSHKGIQSPTTKCSKQPLGLSQMGVLNGRSEMFMLQEPQDQSSYAQPKDLPASSIQDNTEYWFEKMNGLLAQIQQCIATPQE
ncbi:uncharacterized protein PAF06_012594 [Gastrophryne carolinensis]